MGATPVTTAMGAWTGPIVQPAGAARRTTTGADRRAAPINALSPDWNSAWING